MQVEKLARDQMKQTIPNYSNVGVGEAWDHLQSKVRQSYTAQHANVTIHRTLWAISGPPTLGISSRFTSCGSESIRYWVYKHCAVELTHIFNVTLSYVTHLHHGSTQQSLQYLISVQFQSSHYYSLCRKIFR